MPGLFTVFFATFYGGSGKNTADKDSRYNHLALVSKQSQCTEIKQYDQFFLRWTWSFNRDLLEKFRPDRLIEQDT